MKENKHKEIKQKPGGRLPKEQPSRALPKTMARQVWLKSKERVLSATKTDSEGSYASAQEMEEQGIRQGETLMEDGAVSALGKAGTAARRHFVHEHEPNGWPTQEEIRGVDSVSPDAMNPDPKTAARQEQKRRAAQKQSRIFQERQRQSKNAVRGGAVWIGIKNNSAPQPIRCGKRGRPNKRLSEHRRYCAMPGKRPGRVWRRPKRPRLFCTQPFDIFWLRCRALLLR